MCNVEIYGHRGASGSAFENTISAFQRAVVEGADGIEIDVQLTKDSVPIVIHDRNLSRVASRDRFVDEMNFKSLRRVKLGSLWQRRLKNLYIPTLKEVVHFCELHNLKLNVELKETVAERPEQIKQIVELLERIAPLIHVSSFHYEVIEEVKRQNRSIETAYLLKKKQVRQCNWEQYYAADTFHFHYKYWTDEIEQYVREKEWGIRLYGVEGKEEILRSSPAPIIGWITDYPERVRKKLLPSEK